ncbi:MAG: hypothetical protein ACFCUT_03685 [Kiloniellaceae bacterium]
MRIAGNVELDDREALFVGALCSGAAPTNAAKQAGFAISYARDLLLRPRIRAAVLAIAGNAQEALRLMEITANPPAKANREVHR